MSNRRCQHFSEFWPWYLNQHRDPKCRALHYLGTLSLIVVTGLAFAYSFWLLLLLPVVGYAPSWIGHFLIEKNRPATFGRPFWAAFADFKMFGLALTGRLQPHLDAAAAIEDHPQQTTATTEEKPVSAARTPLAVIAGTAGAEIESILLVFSDQMLTVL